MRNSYPVVLLIILNVFLSSQSSATELDFSRLSLGAQWQKNRLYYGQTETQDNPSLNLYSRYELSRYSYIGADINEAKADGQRQRHRNINGFLAADYPILDGRLYVGGSIKQRWFLNAGQNWNYHEWGAQLWHSSGVVLRAEYAPDFYHLSTSALLLHTGITRAFNDQWYWQAQANRFSSPESDKAFFYQAGVGFNHGRWNIEAGFYYAPKPDLSVPGGRIEPSQILLQTSWAIF